MSRRYIRHSSIVKAWATLGEECPFELLRADPGEPGCFGCGWRTPTPDAAERLGDSFSEWDLVGGLLEKAHLVDHSADPSLDDDPLNYALLCRRCHRSMTRTVFGVGDAEAAISWILGRPEREWAYQLLTDSPEIRAAVDQSNKREYARALDKLRDGLDAELARERTCAS
ncbi:hypothetical protein N1031_06765 [Herbiconiux moechotypicola]|uniref:HNH endonuclease n=1 Tax=Herbiconiux moechotypicola TaxID=637393 RepID=A0ABN3DFR9_9MICO|nr:hypothetical protein [Herbiconiux moechotypicola]MCS5729459.1 hypothetical protein [Herbiconiux moechotypicola]